MSAIASREVVLDLAVGIVVAYLGHNAVTAERLPEVIRSVYQALDGLGTDPPPESVEGRRRPAVPVHRSVFPDHIVCLEDGRKVMMLKRHLSQSHGLTPDDYRKRWGLPPNYPMVAPTYAAKRSFLAKELGLGKTPAPPRPHQAPPEPSVQRVAEGVRGHRRKPNSSP